MKEVVKNFKNYSFINEELLVNGMGIDESKLRGNLIKVSKNGKNTILLPTSNNFLLFINKEKDLEGEEEIKKKNLAGEEEIKKEEVAINKKFKNLYYVKEITKKIFILFMKKNLKKN